MIWFLAFGLILYNMGHPLGIYKDVRIFMAVNMIKSSGLLLLFIFTLYFMNLFISALEKYVG